MLGLAMLYIIGRTLGFTGVYWWLWGIDAAIVMIRFGVTIAEKARG